MIGDRLCNYCVYNIQKNPISWNSSFYLSNFVVSWTGTAVPFRMEYTCRKVQFISYVRMRFVEIHSRENSHGSGYRRDTRTPWKNSNNIDSMIIRHLALMTMEDL